MTAPQRPASNSDARKRRAHDAAQRLRDESDEFMNYIRAVAWDEGYTAGQSTDKGAWTQVPNPYRSVS